jgi:hypothetical protein
VKITRIELYHVSVPLRETFWPTWIPGYPQTHNRFTLIKLRESRVTAPVPPWERSARGWATFWAAT